MSNKQKFLNYLLSFGSVVLLNYLDVLTTLIGLSQGFSERNSFISIVLRDHGIGGFILVKVVAMLLICISVVKDKYTFTLIYIMYSFIVLNNVNIIYEPSLLLMAGYALLLLSIFVFIFKNNTYYGKEYYWFADNSPIYTCNTCGEKRRHIPKGIGPHRGYGVTAESLGASDKELCIICYRESIEIEDNILTNASSTLVHQIYSSNNTNAILAKEEALND